MTASIPRRALRRPKDRRVLGIVLTVGAVLIGGLWIGRLEPTHAPVALDRAAVDPRKDPTAHASQARQAEVSQRFEAAVQMLRASRFDAAADTLRRVLELAPDMPEAHVNMGFALLGLQRPTLARNYFDRATTLNPNQANAYYGLALASEARGEVDLAIGAMRAYLHLARAEDEAHLRRARAALWEWETRVAAQRANAKR